MSLQDLKNSLARFSSSCGEIGQPLTEPLRHNDRVSCARFSLDGLRVVTASEDRVLDAGWTQWKRRSKWRRVVPGLSARTRHFQLELADHYESKKNHVSPK